MRLRLAAVAALLLGLGAWLPGAIAGTTHHAVTRASAAATATATGTGTGTGTGTATATAMPPIHHVFILIDENESDSTTFGPNSPAPYLAKTLRAEGAYLPNYYGIGHNSLDNYIAMISGQAPNLDTREDCLFYSNVEPTTIGADGQVKGTGCVYPADVPTIASQLTAAGLTWRDYNDSMGSEPTREAAECGHPPLDTLDNTQTETSTDQYASRHDPFVYFHSIIDNTSLCDSHVVNLDLLPHDLASAADTPNYVFITPGLCDDGHDAKCANGGPGGLPQANTFLQEWVPKIMSSPAFTQENGLLIVTFDEAATSDARSCCGEIAGPETSEPGGGGPGGGDVGAVLLSPCIAPGTISDEPYNHYTMLRSVEDIFGLAHLGYAQLPGESSFGSDVFTGKCAQPPVERLRARAGPGRRVSLGWSAASTAVASSYEVEVSELRPHRSGWRVLTRATRQHSLRYTGQAGVTYRFRVRGTNLTGTGAWATSTLRL